MFINCQFRSAGAAGRYFVLAAVMAIFASFSSPALANGGSPWTVASVKGAAKFVTGAGAASEAIDGRPVNAGTTIVTGDDGMVVLARRGDSITVYPNSRMMVPASQNGEEPGIMQSLGKLLFRMESRESRDFNVDTPYLAAAIKGTTFTVEVEQREATVAVTEGLVQVTANASGKVAYVGAGQKAEVNEAASGVVNVARIEQDVVAKKKWWQVGSFDPENRDGVNNGGSARSDDDDDSHDSDRSDSDSESKGDD